LLQFVAPITPTSTKMSDPSDSRPVSMPNNLHQEISGLLNLTQTYAVPDEDESFFMKTLAMYSDKFFYLQRINMIKIFQDNSKKHVI
jgi:hypothetical protein